MTPWESLLQSNNGSSIIKQLALKAFFILEYIYIYIYNYIYIYIYIYNLRYGDDLTPSRITTQFYFSITLYIFSKLSNLRSCSQNNFVNKNASLKA